MSLIIGAGCVYNEKCGIIIGSRYDTRLILCDGEIMGVTEFELLPEPIENCLHALDKFILYSKENKFVKTVEESLKLIEGGTDKYFVVKAKCMNGVKFEHPITHKLSDGNIYYTPALCHDRYTQHVWGKNPNQDRFNLRNALIHRIRENAIRHTNAMINI